jgi:hypothetical protein
MEAQLKDAWALFENAWKVRLNEKQPVIFCWIKKLYRGQKVKNVTLKEYNLWCLALKRWLIWKMWQQLLNLNLQYLQ